MCRRNIIWWRTTPPISNLRNACRERPACAALPVSLSSVKTPRFIPSLLISPHPPPLPYPAPTQHLLSCSSELRLRPRFLSFKSKVLPKRQVRMKQGLKATCRHLMISMPIFQWEGRGRECTRPPELGAEQGSAAQSLGSWGRASQGWVCTHVPLCTRTEDTFSW